MRTRIRKQPGALRTVPNLLDYDAACRGFSWKTSCARQYALAGRDAFNIAHEAVDRHAQTQQGAHVALRWMTRSGAPVEFSYAEFARQSSRFANALHGLGIGAGDTVFLLLAGMPAFHIALLGGLKIRCVMAPVSADLDAAAVIRRMRLGEARVLVTTSQWAQRHSAKLAQQVPTLRRLITVEGGGAGASFQDTRHADWDGCMESASDHFQIGSTDFEDPALLLFTADSQGRLAGVIHSHGAALSWLVSGRYALDLHPQDVLWCTAEAGSAIGTCYGILAALLCGATAVSSAARVTPKNFCSVVHAAQVSVCCTTPGTVRTLMREGLPQDVYLPRLRLLVSIGEPLTPEAVDWSARALRCVIHDNWWQPEMGAIVIGNFAALDIKPGSVGRPLPGIEAAVVRRDARGHVCIADEPGVEGELALRPDWPSLMRSPRGDQCVLQARIVEGWYLTGVLARFDADGYVWLLAGAPVGLKAALAPREPHIRRGDLGTGMPG